jgi:hypothetical protein
MITLWGGPVSIMVFAAAVGGAAIAATASRETRTVQPVPRAGGVDAR